MSREELDAELHGAVWGIGLLMGSDGLGLTAAAVTLAEVIDRPLTPLETIELARGWAAGAEARTETNTTET